MRNHKNHTNGYSIEEISLMGVVARKQVPWKKRLITKTYCKISEVEFAYRSSLDDKFTFHDGGMKGKPDNQTNPFICSI